MFLLLFIALLLPGTRCVAAVAQSAVSGQSGAGLTRGVVIQPVVNMYRSASEDTDVVSQAIYSWRVSLIEEKGDWLKVTTADDYSGWIRSAAVRRFAEGEHEYGTSGRVGHVRSIYCHLYREPDVTKHAPLLTVPFETRLEIVQEPKSGGGEGRWLQARLPDERAAWVQRGDLEFEPRPLTIAQTIRLARRFLGLPYTWGGTSSFGYDCSGFTQMLGRMRGIVMPRDAGPQAQWTGVKRITRRHLRAGDLLYFGSSEKRITHTGMYIGHGRFIHATTYQHPVIQISRLRDAHWTKLLVATRRAKAPARKAAAIDIRRAVGERAATSQLLPWSTAFQYTASAAATEPEPEALSPLTGLVRSCAFSQGLRRGL